MAKLQLVGLNVARGPPIERKRNATGHPEAMRAKRESWWGWRRRRLSAVGWGYVILMVLIFSLSSAWSLLLIVLNLEPSGSANYILQTESLDNGRFWQSRKATSTILVTATTLLLVVTGVYCYLLYVLLFKPPSRRVQPQEQNRNRAANKLVAQNQTSNPPSVRGVPQMVGTVIGIYRSVVSTDGKHRKAWNVLMEIPEVILQILSLREHMAQGLDSSLLYCYASLMALNAFVAFYDIQFRWNDSTLHHILKDSIVDAAFAVFFPALILFYSFSVFQDDLKTVKIRQKFFPPRVFERKARNYVSAKELNMFSTDFESLLVRSWWDIFLKLSFSLLACFRWSKITAVLLRREHKADRSARVPVSRHKLTGAKSNSNSVASVNAAGIAVKTDLHAGRSVVHQMLRQMVGIFFLIYGIGCIVYTIFAVQNSQASCSSYPQCAQFSYQWILGASNEACGCIAYVDRELAPADSTDLVDVSQTLAELASAGKLQTVQLVNRRLNGSLPDELQACERLRNLVLIHTGVELFPSWTSSTFSKLEYLHVKGDASDTNLMELPRNLFAAMAHLHTIHLSYHANLPELPSLDGLESLESVYFGYLKMIEKLPSMENLQAIQVVALEGLPRVRVLPNVGPYQETLEMVFVQNTPACCSGFLSEGACNTSFPTCCGPPALDGSAGGHSKEKLPSTCLHLPEEESLLPASTTLSVLDQYISNTSNFCDAGQATCPRVVRSIFGVGVEEDTCAGVLFRECSSELSGPGICFNEDLGRVKCVHAQATIDMRRAEIAAGCPCSAGEEKWLGCS